MKKKSIDGFIPRNRVTKTKSLGSDGSTIDIEKPRHDGTRPVLRDISEAHQTEKVSLTPEEPLKKAKKEKKPKKLKEPKEKKKKSIVRRILSCIALLLAGAIVFVAIRYGKLAVTAITASNNVFNGGILGYLKKDRLQTDSEGRTNILVFGTADEGKGHDGELLTDSLMVVSLNQDQKVATLVSVPRDLYVKYDEPCIVGYYGRINAVYECGANFHENKDTYKQDEKNGAEALKKKMTEVTGLDIQYYVHLSFTAIIKTVDIVGGVEVVIDSPDPRGILDRNFDWECKYKCYYVKYANGPTGLMDGRHALALARARGAANYYLEGYGLADNFDREQYQQKIMVALLEKATSTGTLSDLNKIQSLLDTLGNKGYIHTSVGTNEVRTFLDVGQGVKGDDIEHISLATLMTSKMIGGQSVLAPYAGDYNYSSIKAYIAQYLSTDDVIKEGATVSVYNGSDTAGLAAALKNELTNNNIKVVTAENTDQRPEDHIVIYMNKKKKATRAKLESLYNVTVKSSKELPAELSADTSDFVIIITNEDALHG